MSEYENVQPEETLEGRESTENVEERTLQEAAHEPGARVEETQTFEQAEAVEKAVTEAVDNIEMAEVKPDSGAEDEEDMQLISGPSRDDLPDGTGILEEPHETVEMAEKPEDRGVAVVAEVPEGIEFELAGEDVAVDRDDDGLIRDPDISEASGEKDDDGGDKHSISDKDDDPEPLPLEPPDPDPM